MHIKLTHTELFLFASMSGFFGASLFGIGSFLVDEHRCERADSLPHASSESAGAAVLMAATGEHPIDRETASTAVESHSGANAEDPRLESRRPPCSDDVEVEGGLDKHVIRRIVRAHISEVRACYNAGIAEDPELAGRVNVQFSIDAEGTVAAAVVHESTLRDAATASCIAQAVRGWKFPKPTGGGTVMVTYPFLLSAGD